VSRMTVSNAFNRPDQVAAATRERVMRVARELGYTGPDPAGRSLRRGRSGTIGVLLTEKLPYAFSDPGTLMFLHGVASELAESGLALLLLPAEANVEHGVVRNAIVDGFLLVMVAPSDPVVADVLERRLPTVSSGYPRIPGVARLAVDDAAATGEIGRHLAGLGHRRFAAITFGETPDADPAAAVRGVHLAMRRRVAGFVAGTGVATEDVTVGAARGNSRADGAHAATRLLDVPAARRPTAVFAVTDVLALGVLDAASRLGIGVPDRLSVAGFDDIPQAAHSRPPLTTVWHGLFDRGRYAARMVVDRIDGRRSRPPILTPRLIVRESTGPAPR
jgi:DNA-binding LacI/PurR family transcriptional regulator